MNRRLRPGIESCSESILLHLRELRIDDWRVFYDVSHDPEEVVTITAIGQKVRNRYIIGGEEVEV